MQLIQNGNWKKPISIPDLLEQKGCNEFTLLEECLIVHFQFYEIWWYAYKSRNHIIAKQCTYPYTLYFFLMEPGDLFQVKDFKRYLETGELVQPSVKMYINSDLYN